jgi:hypothetical protein
MNNAIAAVVLTRQGSLGTAWMSLFNTVGVFCFKGVFHFEAFRG